MIREWYDRHLLPPLLDCACGMGDIHKERAAIVPLATGRTLEIGIGSGLNLSHYDKSRLTELHALDPAPELTRRAQKRAERVGIDVQLLQLGAEDIPADDGSFDTVVCTFTLCTIPDAPAALAEMRRVLKPGGQLLFCEHGLSPSPAVARWQSRINRVWSPLAGGCRLDRNSPALLREAGFRIHDLHQHYLPGPKPWTYVSRGIATLEA